MTSIIEEPPSSKKDVPANALIIEINDDEEDNLISDQQYYELFCKELIESAILTKNLDFMKKSIFICLNRMRTKTDKNVAERAIRKAYVEYFKLHLNLDISRAFYRSPVQAIDPAAQPNKSHIIVHGVDFLSNSQLEAKFKGIHPVTIQRINASNVSIKFNENELVQNVLDVLKETRKDPDVQEIEEEGWSKWKYLKKYDVLGFDRPLKFRYGAMDQKPFLKEDYNTRSFDVAKSKIQESDLFITCKEDKDFYDQKIKEFEQNLYYRKSRYSRRSRSDNGESQRSRTRDRRNNFRNQNNEGGDTNIDNFERKFNRNDRNDRGERGNFTDRGNFNDRNRGGYQTERNNFDRRDGNDRREGNFRGNRGRGGFGDRQNQDRSNFRRNYGRDFNNGRENRFFNKDNNRQNNSKIDEEKDVSYEIPKKSVSRSNSSKSRSYKANESMQVPFNPANVSMSFVIPEKTQAKVNPEVSQSFALNQTTINPIQDVTESFILPLGKIHKQEQDDNKSQQDLENILKKLDEEKIEMEKAEQKRKRSRSNSSVGSRSVASRRNSSQKNKRNGSAKESNKGSQKSFNNRQNQGGYRGNNNRNFNQRNNNFNNNRNNDYGNNRYNNDSAQNNGNYGRGNRFNNNFDGNDGNRNENGFQRKNYGHNNQRNNNYNNGNRYQGPRQDQQREGQERNFNNNNRYDRSNNNNNNQNFNNNNRDRYNNDQGREADNVFDQYKKREKPKVSQNLDEDEIEY